jgi:hypothetical protein
MNPTVTLSADTTWCRIEQSANNGGFYVTYQATGRSSRRYRDRRHESLAAAQAATREWMKRFRYKPDGRQPMADGRSDATRPSGPLREP